MSQGRVPGIFENELIENGVIMSDAAEKRLQEEFDKNVQWELTDEDIERAKLLLGVDTAGGQKGDWIQTASEDSIRNFTWSVGDDNPLYIDPEYAVGTRWGSQIAPNSMAEIITKPLLGDPIDKELKKKTRGVFRGIHVFVSGSEKYWYRPIYPGDTLYSYGGQDGLEVKPSEFAGRSVTRFSRRVKINQRGEPVFLQRSRAIYTERKAAAKKGKYMELKPAEYTDEDLERIDNIYAQEQRRGAEPRYWEDVEVGEKMPDYCKGPLTGTEILAYHAGGYGITTYGLCGSRLWHKNRKAIAPFYIKNEAGIPDVAQRVHWDSKWAQAIGNPMAYDYSVVREGWLHHYLSDWAGDDGWVYRQYDEMRKFNYIGDTQFLQGEVVKKYVENGRHCVDLMLKMINQRDMVTVQGEGTVMLPSREHGPVILPEAPDDIRQKSTTMWKRHGELWREKHSA